MALTRKLVTAEELFQWPDDGQRHELVGGELRTMAPSGAEHGEIGLALATSLRQYVRAHQLGRVFGAETGFLLARDPDTVRAPDVAFIRRVRAEAAGRVTGYWPGAPDLAVEVVSPGDRPAEVAEKVAMWLAHGTQVVLVVEPRTQTVVVHRAPGQVTRLTVADTLDGGEVVPGWRLPLREVFTLDD